MQDEVCTLENSFDFILSKWNKKQKDCTHQHHLKKKSELEQRLEKKLNDVYSSNNHTNIIKEIIAFFKEKSHKSKRISKNLKTLNTKIESVDSFINIGATSTSITLSITGVGFNVLPISAGIACTLS